jgi:hypothetical protein
MVCNPGLEFGQKGNLDMVTVRKPSCVSQNGSVDFECEFPNSIGNKMAELPLFQSGAVQDLSHQPFA